MLLVEERHSATSRYLSQQMLFTVFGNSAEVGCRSECELGPQICFLIGHLEPYLADSDTPRPSAVGHKVAFPRPGAERPLSVGIRDLRQEERQRVRRAGSSHK